MGQFFVTSDYEQMRVRVNYTQSKNIASNTSTVSITSVTVERISDKGYWGYGYKPTGYVKVDGNEAVNFSGSSLTIPQTVGSAGTISPSTGSRNVSHDAQGKKTVTLEVRVHTGDFTVQGSETVTLEDIPRVSKPSLSNTKPYFGGNVVIYTNRKADSFTHVLKLVYGSEEISIASSVGASYTWTIPHSLISKIGKTAMSMSAAVKCCTYSGSTQIGYDTTPITISVVEDSCTKPSISSVSVTASGSALSGFIQGVTNAVAAFSESDAYSTITKREFSIDGNTKTGTSPISSNILNSSGNLTWKIKLTNGRNFTNEATGTISVQEYHIPKIRGNVDRCNAYGTAQRGGTAALFSITVDYTKLSGNSCTFQYRKRTENGSFGSWSNVPSSGTISQGFCPDAEINYVVEVKAADTVGNIATAQFSLLSTFHTIHLKQGGKGIAFGKMATGDGFECAMDALFLGNVNCAKIIRSAYGSGHGGNWKSDTLQLETDAIYLVTASHSSGGILFAVITTTLDSPQIAMLSQSSYCRISVSNSCVLTMESQWYSKWTVVKM